MPLARIDTPRIAGHAAQRMSRQPFILIFCGPPGDVLTEGLCTLSVEDGRRFELYLIPIQTPGADRQDYQAVFN